MIQDGKSVIILSTSWIKVSFNVVAIATLVRCIDSNCDAKKIGRRPFVRSVTPLVALEGAISEVEKSSMEVLRIVILLVLSWPSLSSSFSVVDSLVMLPIMHNLRYWVNRSVKNYVKYDSRIRMR
jgi:hypothetical protein